MTNIKMNPELGKNELLLLQVILFKIKELGLPSGINELTFSIEQFKAVTGISTDLRLQQLNLSITIINDENTVSINPFETVRWTEDKLTVITSEILYTYIDKIIKGLLQYLYNKTLQETNLVGFKMIWVFKLIDGLTL